MDQAFFAKYANGLKGDDRDTLSFFPFKWAYAPPHDPTSAVSFLKEISVENHTVSSEMVRVKFEAMISMDQLLQKGSVEWGGEILHDNPPPGFRMIPEWEKMAGVLFNWPTLFPPLWSMFAQMMKSLDHVIIFLRIPEGYLGAAVLAWLDAAGIDLTRVRPIPGPLGDSWARDYSPLYGVNRYTGEPVAHKFSFAAFWPQYRETCREIVDIDEKFTWKEGYRVFRSEIFLDGGNILTDGNGTYVLTRRVIRDNLAVPNLQVKLEAWLGAERLIIVDEEPDDLLGHINHFKFITPEKIIIGQSNRPDSPVSRYLENLCGLFDRYGYEVIRIPAPEGFDHLLPGGDCTHTALFANSLMMNKRILVATYDQDGLEKYNEEAIEVYGRTLPEYTIIPVDATIQGNAGGAINCSSKEIPDVEHLTG
jgi:agmatine/peptidylarginine deiminase